MLKSGDKSNAAMWLTDNFHVIEKSYANALRVYKIHKISADSDTASICLSICKDGVLPDEEQIIAALLGKDISTAQLRGLPFFMTAALFTVLAKNIHASETVAVNAIKSLMRLRDTDFGLILFEVSETEKILCQDPAGRYRNMDEQTKDLYRDAVCAMAEKTKQREVQVAVNALEQAEAASRHIGFFLDIYKDKRAMGKAVLAMESLIPLIAACLTALLTDAWYLAPLLYLPFREALKFLSNLFASAFQCSKPLPKMAFSCGIPETCKTVMALSVLLPPASKAREIIPHLKDLYLSNCKENTCICVLADLKSAQTPTAVSDKADIKAMKRVIAKLNADYNGAFILAVRPRKFSETENEYTGHERKRGAITALVKFIANGENEFLALLGDENKLLGAKYLMALDSDTEMPIGSLQSLVETAAHPLNEPQISLTQQRVIRGYGILSPRVETSIESAAKTHFSGIFAGTGGIPAYSNACGERYQDYFAQSIFSGKGLIHVESFSKLLIDRFPEQRVLSHDIMEGMILRTGFCGDTALTDSFPSNETAYFKRLHRWIRGDVQNLLFLKNKHIPTIGKWWIMDNIGRSAAPALAVTALLLAVLMPHKAAVATAVTALACAAFPDFISALLTLLKGGISMLSRLYFSSAAPYALTCLLRATAQTVMLVRHAFCAADAAVRALFRLLISKKHLLQWTTAAEGEKKQSISVEIKKSLPSVAVGLFLIIFGTDILRLAGLLFAVDLPFSMLSSLPKTSRQPRLTEHERAQLFTYCASMWKFYEQHCNKDNHFLIPDNVQETPVYSVAKRTSPTNIGLMLCAFLAARDMDFISTAELQSLTERALETIEKLEKFKGNLYNWYSTDALAVLKPAFISCVDSGNFLCCLTAFKEGLRGYTAEQPTLFNAIERIEKLIAQTDLGFLFDKRRNLFHIGYDSDTGEFTASYFDLLMSEARMTSYYASASGAAPVKHWQSLGRTLAKSGRYTGPVSWSGTMFEYFMPAIFLPSIRDSLGHEALRFCIHCQKKRVKNMNIPYGISESGYFAFDRELNYQYKAHGVSALSLRSAPFTDTVVSPYSTFLTLPTDPHGSMNNLKKLKKIGMYGQYGFFEAADYTANDNSKGYSCVKSFMSHHVGMSFLSASNALFDNIMQKRFMADDRMAGGRSLLYEKIPSDARVYKSVERCAAPKRPDRIQKSKAEYHHISALQPNVHLLSSGEWTLYTTDTGSNQSIFANRFMFRNHKESFPGHSGIFAAVKNQEGDIIPFTLSPKLTNGSYAASFSETAAVYKNANDDLSCTQTMTLHPDFPAQIIHFTVKNKTKSKKETELLLYAEPQLTETDENITHPAFSNMFIECGEIDGEKAVYFTRRNSRKGNSLYIVCGFLSKASFRCAFDREAVIPRDKGIFGLFDNALNEESTSVDKCIALQIKLHLSPRSIAKECFILCGAGSLEEAVNNLISIRKQGLLQNTKKSFLPFHNESLESIYAKKIVERACFGKPLSREISAALRQNMLSRGDLWSMGLSGDYPIITVKTDAEDETYMNTFIRMHSKLKLLGMTTELALISDEKDEYTDAMQDAVRLLTNGDVLNKRGGIFTLCIKDISKEQFTLLLASSTAIYPEKATDGNRQTASFISIYSANKAADTKNLFIKNGYMINQKPYLPWSHILCNRNFGTLLTDSDLGYTWAMNARENKLTPWSNDTRSIDAGERLILADDGKLFDVISGSTAFFTSGKAQYFSTINAFIIKTEVEVPGESMCKVITVRIKNEQSASREFSLYYYVKPILGDNAGNSRYIQYEETAEGAYAYTPYNTSFGGYMLVSADGKCQYSFSKRAFFTDYSQDGDRDCIIVQRKIYLPGKSEKSVKFYLSYAKNKSAAEKMIYIPPKKHNENCIKIETPDNELNRLFNDFLPNQILGGRLYGRTGFYQCSGAYGFRDQLQDAMSLALTHPDVLKIQIFRCAAAQFTEGDVLHWFHEFHIGNKRFLRGVRTRYSDDLLWLPLAVSEYCLKCGDFSILKTQIPFIEAPPLEHGEAERFGEYTLSGQKASLFNHCLQTFKHACVFGSHALPLIKGGDWNDSFNLVGIQGRGESVWLAMFLAYTAKKFATVCHIIGETEISEKLSGLVTRLFAATDAHAWSGDRYLRCFYDDGTPMGRADAPHCAIDLLPQAWSVIAEMPNKSRCTTAIETAYDNLVDAKHGLIKLFTPSFDLNSKETGYVNRYPAGIRENGGQYSHGAVWLADAFFRAGDAEKGYALLNILNPAKKNIAVYKTEPYYLAGDVYAHKGLEGRGGWSLYTGSAGWFYRTVYERMLGITQIGGEIKIKPCLPKGFEKSRVKIITNNGTRDYII